MKTVLSEEDIKFRFITPAIEKAGWTKDSIRMEYSFTDGQMFVNGNKTRRGQSKRADYILFKNGTFPLAIIEAKKLEDTSDSGLQQAMNYAEILNLPFAYACNGRSFIEHDFLTGKERQFPMNEFPTENELWQRYCNAKNFTPSQESIMLQPDYRNVIQNRKARYYQRIAIDKTVQAVAQGRRRNLIVLATGTGKTFVAFQIVWKLIQSGTVKRVLYLADRNILIDQTMQQDFSPLKKIMCKVQNKQLDSAYEVFMSLYHQLAGEDGEESFRQFQPGFRFNNC